jgi:hypothetical protein
MICPLITNEFNFCREGGEGGEGEAIGKVEKEKERNRKRRLI